MRVAPHTEDFKLIERYFTPAPDKHYLQYFLPSLSAHTWSVLGSSNWHTFMVPRASWPTSCVAVATVPDLRQQDSTSAEFGFILRS
jgi:hypothetical protein